MSDPFHEQVARLRREQILDAAVKVFAERGFHRSTIRDIARAAGVADGTIYNYFENKTALLLGILDPLNEREQPTAALMAAAPDDVRGFFRHFFTQRLLAFEGPKLDALRVVLSEVLVNADLRDLFVARIIGPAITLAEPALAQLVAAGKLRRLDVAVAMRAILATFLGVLTLHMLGDEIVREHWAELPDLLATVLVDGMKVAAET